MSYINSKSEFGELRANSDAEKNSNLKLPKCDQTGLSTCEDSAVDTVSNTRTVVSITFEGVVLTFPTPIAVTSPELIQAEIVAWLDTDFVDEHRPYLRAQDNKEINPFVSVAYDGTDITVVHIGQGTLATITYDDASTTSLTRLCTIVKACVYRASGEGTIGPVVVNTTGSSEALAADPFTYTDGGAGDVVIAGNLQTQLAAAITASDAAAVVYDALVTIDNDNAEYIMDVKVPEGTVINLTGLGVEMTLCYCEEIFIA